MTYLPYGLIVSKLGLKNFATFDDQIITFESGFNAIVGETGSGKSLILDAIQLILGQRADKKLVRKDCDFSIVEATFKCESHGIKDYFNNLGYPFDEDEIIVKRILYKNGKTKSFINHQSCSVTMLANFSKRFVDLVGQFENQKLLSDNYQMILLDNFSLNHVLLQEYTESFNQLSILKDELLEKKKIATELKQKKDYIEFQLNELEKLSPSIEREQELLDKKRILQNVEENKHIIEEFNHIFEGDLHSVGLSTLLTKIENLISLDILSENDINSFHQAKDILSDINYKINSSWEEEIDEEEFESVIDELDLYQKLKRKYSVDTEALSELFENFKSELAQIEDIDFELDQLKIKISKQEEHTTKLANALHLKRVEHAKKLSKLLSHEVQQLRMNGATIKIELAKMPTLTKSGNSIINFIAETNPGEGFYKIKDIASGGELSRILLALRTILSSQDSISIFLFDEIDTGIGGETANAVGKSLEKVSLNSQVVAITHLPQIAKCATKLISVSKTLVESRTVSQVTELSGAQLTTELNTMAGI